MLSLMYVPAEAVTSKQKGFLAPYFDAVCKMCIRDRNIDLMPTILQHHGCKIPERVKGMSLRDIAEDREKPREQVIYGWFGRAVNVYDGRYTYFRAPENRENSPLYQYCTCLLYTSRCV